MYQGFTSSFNASGVPKRKKLFGMKLYFGISCFLYWIGRYILYNESRREENNKRKGYENGNRIQRLGRICYGWKVCWGNRERQVYGRISPVVHAQDWECWISFNVSRQVCFLQLFGYRLTPKRTTYRIRKRGNKPCKRKRSTGILPIGRVIGMRYGMVG